MFVYEKRLQYPVKIKNTNPKLASLIISQYGGPDGELGASLRYLSQRYSMPYPELKGLLTDIGTEELGHMEMVAAIVHQLTRNLSDEDVRNNSAFAPYFVDHTTGVYPTAAAAESGLEPFTYTAGPVAAPAVRAAKPKALIPVFPGTNCEYDTARAIIDAGGDAEILVVRNLNAEQVAASAQRVAEAIRAAQMIVIPGGFSGGDEPDGSGKFITAFFRSPAVREAVTELMDRRGGLMLGICNGFQALIKLGLVPFGRIVDADESCPTLTFNTIGRHQSSIVRTRVCSNLSPWLAETEPGGVYSVPISHGEGRFIAPEAVIRSLAERGQVATQYVDLDGAPSMDTAFNPNGSLYAIEGITSPDGRVFGKMGHSERYSDNVYKNVDGNKDNGMFKNAVDYFKI